LGDAIHTLVRDVAAHAHLAYAALFLAAFLEAVPVAGSLVPGSTVILSLSALIATGDLSLAAVLAAAIAGAVAGDGLAFLLGRHYAGRILGAWPLSNYPGAVERAETFFRKYGDAAVFLARFLPPVRAFVPITAGTTGMSPARFYAFNILAILCWAPAHVVPGILAGEAYGHAGAIAEHLSLPVIAGIVTLALMLWIVWRWRRRGKP
jgi:membrane-associated protein